MMTNNKQSHTRTLKYAAETIDGARAAMPRDASYVWRDQTCFYRTPFFRPSLDQLMFLFLSRFKPENVLSGFLAMFIYINYVFYESIKT